MSEARDTMPTKLFMGNEVVAYLILGMEPSVNEDMERFLARARRKLAGERVVRREEKESA